MMVDTEFGKSKVDSGSTHWNGTASLVEASTAIKGVDTRAKALGGEAGYTCFAGNQGADIGFRGNITYVSGAIGLLYFRLGESVDTGLRLRGGDDWAIGGELFGTGVTIGRTTKILFSGNELSWRWY